MLASSCGRCTGELSGAARMALSFSAMFYQIVVDKVVPFVESSVALSVLKKL